MRRPRHVRSCMCIGLDVSHGINANWPLSLCRLGWRLESAGNLLWVVGTSDMALVLGARAEGDRERPHPGERRVSDSGQVTIG